MNFLKLSTMILAEGFGESEIGMNKSVLRSRIIFMQFRLRVQFFDAAPVPTPAHSHVKSKLTFKKGHTLKLFFHLTLYCIYNIISGKCNGETL
jgi:hypothetical protein